VQRGRTVYLKHAELKVGLAQAPHHLQLIGVQLAVEDRFLNSVPSPGPVARRGHDLFQHHGELVQASLAEVQRRAALARDRLWVQRALDLLAHARHEC
jgi:hypothetical protein